MSHLLPLQFLRAGQLAVVDSLIGSAEQVHRLEEIGLRKGSSVEMVQPGSPCIVRLAGSTLCLRDAELFQVLVREGDAV